MLRTRSYQFISGLMLVLLFSTVVTKDLYHLLLPHAYTAHNNISEDGTAGLFDECEKEAECFICNFDFSTCECDIIASATSPEELPCCPDALRYVSPDLQDHIGSPSLRGPPAVC